MYQLAIVLHSGGVKKVIRTLSQSFDDFDAAVTAKILQQDVINRAFTKSSDGDKYLVEIQ